MLGEGIIALVITPREPTESAPEYYVITLSGFLIIYMLLLVHKHSRVGHATP